MQSWRKSLSVKNQCNGSVASSNSTRRNIREETTRLLQQKRQMNGESSNADSMWKPKVPRLRKSIPRRLSYSNNDDSLCLMNVGNSLDDTMKSTPMKEVAAPVIKVTKFEETKKKAFEEDEECGVKKDTLDYLRSIGIIGKRNSQQESKTLTVPAKKVTSAKESVQKDVDDMKETFRHPDPVNINVKQVQNDTDLVSLQLKVKGLLTKQRKEKSELRERYEREIKDLEKNHEEELIGLFNSSAKKSEPAAVADTNISTSKNHIYQEVNTSHDSFLMSPFSGAWKVSNYDDDLVSNDTPTLGFNTTSNVTKNASQLLDTPATRRLVTDRIVQGIESLFYK